MKTKQNSALSKAKILKSHRDYSIQSYRTKGKVRKNKAEREKIAQGDAEFYFLFC